MGGVIHRFEKERQTPVEGWKSFQFNIHYFEVGIVAATKGDYFYTPEFSCNGHRWALKVSPRGSNHTGDGWMSIFLYLRSVGSAVATYEVKMTDRVGVFGKQTKECCYDTRTAGKNPSKGWSNFIRQIDLPKFLDEDGTLSLVVSIKEEKPKNIIPKNSYVATMLLMFNDEEAADVCFEVSNIDVKEDGTKRAKSLLRFMRISALSKSVPPCLPIYLIQLMIMGRR